MSKIKLETYVDYFCSESPRISREHVGKLACLRAQSTAAAGCEARSAEQPADGTVSSIVFLNILVIARSRFYTV
jgi:hypothetical protein